jgi:signal transduction histidine kinase
MRNPRPHWGVRPWPAVAVFLSKITAFGVPDGGPAVLIEKIRVDGVEEKADSDGVLRISLGLHRLDFRVRVDEGSSVFPLLVRATLAGFESDWSVVSGQMALQADFLDAGGQVIAGQRFASSGFTLGAAEEWKRMALLPRREPLLVPPGATGLRLTLTSGAPQTTGRIVMDDLTLNLPGGGLSATQDLWRNSAFATVTGQGAEATPDRWRRGAGDPGIPQVVKGLTTALGGSGGNGIGLVDDDATAFGEWVGETKFDERVTPGMTLTLSWLTAWRVNPGNRHDISYNEVGAGDYTLRVAGIGAAGGWTGASASLPIYIEQFLWQRPWFWPVTVGGTVAVLGGAGVLLWRQRMQRRIERLAAQHTLEKDRARIARDMHDDLGARLTRISLLTALAEREINAGDTPAAQTHVGQLSGLAREVVGAIDEIVWAVDPGNDTLDHLGTYLCRFADEFFAGSPVRCRFGIPPVLPALPLGAEVRHNLFLAVKEGLNNIAKHAGPCEARLELKVTDEVLCIEISDNGAGFHVDPGFSGNGLRNMERRLRDIGGECTIVTSGAGTKVTLRWPLAEEAV